MFNHAQKSIKYIVAVLLFAPCLAMTGCAANPDNMVPDLVRGTTIPGSVAVKVSGTTMGTISSDAFKVAIEKSLERAAAFSTFQRDAPGDYEMEVNYTTEEPAAGFDMTVQVEATYALIRRSNDTVVWKQAISSVCTKTVGDAWIGGQRLTVAEEGAVKENIRDAMAALQQAAPTLR